MKEVKFDVILNRCMDDKFENEIACEVCGQLTSCVVLFGRRVGKCCLDMGSLAISKEICKRLERPPYEELPQKQFFKGVDQ